MRLLKVSTFNGRRNNNKKYIALMPNDESDEIHIYIWRYGNEEFNLIEIKDMDEFIKVIERFNEIAMAED